MRKSKGEGWLAIFGLSAAFAVYTLATQESAQQSSLSAEPSAARTSQNAPLSTVTSNSIVERTSLPAVAAEPATFMGYACTEDCSGHEAGYEWAEENDVTDPGECDGNSDSFIEGCEAYAEEYAASAADEHDY